MNNQAKFATKEEMIITVSNLWRLFTESEESRAAVLEVFDDAEKYFPNKPHIVKWFVGMKEAFLKAEVNNEEIKIKNTVPHLIEAVTTHKDCPDWLKTMIYNRLADKSDIPADCADMYRVMLKYTPTRRDELRELKQTELSETEPDATAPNETEIENIAVLLSSVLNNPSFPAKLAENFKDALTEFINGLPSDKNIEFFSVETSPEYLARLFKVAEAKR